jgi:hypothetical protein
MQSTEKLCRCLRCKYFAYPRLCLYLGCSNKCLRWSAIACCRLLLLVTFRVEMPLVDDAIVLKLRLWQRRSRWLC